MVTVSGDSLGHPSSGIDLRIGTYVDAPGTSTRGLAPIYDLVSIEFFNLLRPGSFSRDLAFSVGTAVEPERIRKADWEEFAAAMGMPKSRLLARVRELAERLPTIAEQSVTAFQEAHREITVADRLVETVNTRCRWTLDTIT